MHGEALYYCLPCSLRGAFKMLRVFSLPRLIPNPVFFAANRLLGYVRLLSNIHVKSRIPPSSNEVFFLQAAPSNCFSRKPQMIRVDSEGAMLSVSELFLLLLFYVVAFLPAPPHAPALKATLATLLCSSLCSTSLRKFGPVAARPAVQAWF